MRVLFVLMLVLVSAAVVGAAGPDWSSAFGVVCPWGGINETGVGWVRGGAGATSLGNWCEIEKTRGNYTWEASDNELKNDLKDGLTPLPILGYTPAWASSGPKQEASSPPKNLLDYARFVGDIVKRYKGKIPCYEIWNEPDIGFWSGTVSDYTDLLKTGYIAAKQADPNCQIVFGGTAGVNIPFLESVYEFGGRSFFDIMAVHPYQWGPEFDDGAFARQLTDLRKTMDEHSDFNKEIWLTELGWSTGDKGITEEIQARLLTQAMVTAMTLQKMGVTRTFWFCVKDWGGPGYGMLRPDGSQKPAYKAYSVLTKTMRGTYYVGKLDLGDGVRCHVFKYPKTGAVVIAVWAPKETTIKLPCVAPNRIYTYMGEKIAPSASGLLQVRPDPVFVMGVDPAIVRQARMPYSPMPGLSSVISGGPPSAWASIIPQEGVTKPYIVAGEETPLTVRVENQGTQPIVGRLTLWFDRLPKPKTIQDFPKVIGAGYSVPANDSRLVTVRVKLPASAKLGPTECKIDGDSIGDLATVQITDSRLIEFYANSTLEGRYLVRNENSGGAPSVRFNGTWTYKFDLTKSKKASVELNVGANNAQEWRVLASNDEQSWKTILSGKSNRAWQTANLDQFVGKPLYLKFDGNDQQLEQLILHY